MIEQPPWSLRFTTTAQDAIDASALVRSTSYHLTTAVVIVIIIGGGFLTLGDTSSLSIGAGLIVGGLTFLLINRTNVGLRWLVRRRVPRLLGVEQGTVVTAAGLDHDSALGSGHIPWSGLTEVRSSVRSVAFLFDGRVRTFVPNRAFTSATDRDAVIAFARTQIASQSAVIGSPPAQ